MSIPWRLPKIQMASFLLLIYLSIFFQYPFINTFVFLLVVISTTLLADFVFLKLRNIKPFLLSAALVTSLILSLILNPSLPIYQTVIICALAIFSKNFIRVGNSHIFNPAGLGVFLGGIIFNYSVSWWAVSFQKLLPLGLLNLLFFLILISPSFASALRMKRYMIIAPFLVIYSLGLQFLGGFNLQNLINTTFDPTVLFFALVMLPEPMTTPNRRLQQILFGIFVAFISLLVSLPIFNTEVLGRSLVADPLILGLLLGNLIFFKFK